MASPEHLQLGSILAMSHVTFPLLSGFQGNRTRKVPTWQILEAVRGFVTPSLLQP